MLFPHFDVFYSGDVAAVSWAGHTFPRWLLLTLATRGCSGAEAVWRWDIKLMDAAAGTVQMVPSSCTVTHRWRHRCNPGSNHAVCRTSTSRSCRGCRGWRPRLRCRVSPPQRSSQPSWSTQSGRRVSRL